RTPAGSAAPSTPHKPRPPPSGGSPQRSARCTVVGNRVDVEPGSFCVSTAAACRMGAILTLNSLLHPSIALTLSYLRSECGVKQRREHAEHDKPGRVRSPDELTSYAV